MLIFQCIFFIAKKTVSPNWPSNEKKERKSNVDGPGFYRGFTGFYWVLLDVTGFELGFTGFKRVLLVFVPVCYWVLAAARSCQLFVLFLFSKSTGCTRRLGRSTITEFRPFCSASPSGKWPVVSTGRRLIQLPLNDASLKRRIRGRCSKMGSRLGAAGKTR